MVERIAVRSGVRDSEETVTMAKTPDEKAAAPAAKAAAPAAKAAAPAARKSSSRPAGGRGTAAPVAGPVDAAPRARVGKPRLLGYYEETVRPRLAKEFGLKNPHQVPRLSKIVLNVGTRRGRRRTPGWSTPRPKSWPRSPGRRR